MLPNEYSRNLSYKMDKSWMTKSRVSKEYQDGLELIFLNFAFSNSSINGKIICPCKECKMGVFVSREQASEHLTVIGFIPRYTVWIAHGELHRNSSSPFEPQHDGLGTSTHMDGVQSLVHDILGDPQENVHMDTGDFSRDTEIPHEKEKQFYDLIDASQKPLYEGCENFTKLSFIIRLLHVKCAGRLTNTVFDMILGLLGDAFPEAMEGLPKSYYEAEKMMKKLGLGYEKIDACPKDCILYWGPNKEKSSCGTCGELRWQTSDKDHMGDKRKIGRKVLWYFPIKPRLQRLFMSSKTACHMRWHFDRRKKDGKLRHPADSPAWHTFDSLHYEFAKDPRNVRLGLASDGFNPFKNMSTTHSTWPVILFPYNLPPGMCMKQPYFLLSLLIPGPLAPGNNIDVYLQPLIADLKDLWEVGIETYDASKGKNFQLRASLLWTISDFPGYANLSGWSTKGKYACPVCHKYTHSLRLKHGGKWCYMGHRKFLVMEHEFRKIRRLFDGKVEFGEKPPKLSGDMVIEELEKFSFKFGKDVKDNPTLPYNWKKLSIFYELPYWKTNVMRHNLDFMHIEKNVCESLCGTILGMDGKNKDNYNARKDLKELGIRPELHLIDNESGEDTKPEASFTMSKKEKKIFCDVLNRIKVPDGYSSNISRRVQVKPPKLIGLKSHDYHILMQQLLPIALRKTLPKFVRSSLLRLSKYFRELCSKEIQPSDAVRLEKEIPVVLCELEKIFPPSFFDVMVHLTVHLATEVKLAGPVQYRWMYPIERYLGTLKSYVRNRSRPEGSIAEGYLAEECISFCSSYLAGYVESKSEKISKIVDSNMDKGAEVELDVFQSVWGRPSNIERFHVEYNKYGQPVDGDRSKLTHFLGSIARNGKYCPIDLTDWRELSSTKKTEILDLVKFRFHVPNKAEKWILSSIGDKWRNWKHYLKTKYWKKDVPVVDMIGNKLDGRVLVEQWTTLLTHWNSKKAKDTSAKNKKARASKSMEKKTGKTSFAQVRHKLEKKLNRLPKRVEIFHACYVKPHSNSSDSSGNSDNSNRESNDVSLIKDVSTHNDGTSSDIALTKYLEMEKRSSQLGENSEDTIGRNDVFAQIMGADRPGQVRMMGKGVCPSDLCGQLPRGESNHLLIEQQARIAHLESMLLAQSRGNTSEVLSRQRIRPVNSLLNHATTTPRLLMGAHVYLKSLCDPKKIVAKGHIQSLSPTTEVGGQVLGSQWCSINVTVILEPEEELIRPHDNLRRIADTLGEIIDWPCRLVMPSKD